MKKTNPKSGPLEWRHNGRDCVSNHQPRDGLLNRLFRLRSKKTSKLRVTGLCAGNSPGPVNSPHKWPVTRKMFPFNDVIIPCYNVTMTLKRSPRYWPIVVTVLPTWMVTRRRLVISLISWTRSWTKSRVAGDFRRLNTRLVIVIPFIHKAPAEDNWDYTIIRKA